MIRLIKTVPAFEPTLYSTTVHTFYNTFPSTARAYPAWPIFRRHKVVTYIALLAQYGKIPVLTAYTNNDHERHKNEDTRMKPVVTFLHLEGYK